VLPDPGGIAAADHIAIGVNAGKIEINVLVAAMQVGEKMREALVHIADLDILHDVETAPGSSILQPFEHDLVDIRRYASRLNGDIAFDFCLNILARLDKGKAGQKYGGQKTDAQESDE